MTTPTIQAAQKGMNRVQKRWGHLIPDKLKSFTAKQIMTFANDSQFRLFYKVAFENVFNPAIKFPEWVTTGDAMAATPAFVTPFNDNATRKIFISMTTMPKYDANQQLMIFSHEYIHWLSHNNFYPEFYKVGGGNPFRVEGMTQWATVESHSTYPGVHNRTKVYVKEYQQTRSCFTDTTVRDAALAYMFQGHKTSLLGITPI